MNSLTSILLSRRNMGDVNEILELYEQELHVSFDSYFSSDENSIRIYCYTPGGGIYPTVLIPIDINSDQFVHEIFGLLEEINVDFNTSLSKLKMKKELQGR